MGIFDKFFKNKEKSESTPDPRDNNSLETILINYNQSNNNEQYGKIASQLMNGDFNLFLPSINDGKSENNWKAIREGSNLKLKSVFNLDGLIVLGAFSNEKNLLNWINEESEYTVMNSKDVLNFCQTNGIDRIVIDSKQPSMFVLERSRSNIKTETVKEETKVRFRKPAVPITGLFFEKLITNFKKVESIEEAYQFIMVRNNESIHIIGFKLSTYSDNSRTACLNAIQNCIDYNNLKLPLELFFLENSDWYNSIKNIEKSIMYMK